MDLTGPNDLTSLPATERPTRFFAPQHLSRVVHCPRCGWLPGSNRGRCPACQRTIVDPTTAGKGAMPLAIWIPEIILVCFMPALMTLGSVWVGALVWACCDRRADLAAILGVSGLLILLASAGILWFIGNIEKGNRQAWRLQISLSAIVLVLSALFLARQIALSYTLIDSGWDIAPTALVLFWNALVLFTWTRRSSLHWFGLGPATNP